MTGKVAFRGWDGKFVVSGGRGKPVAGKIPAPPPTTNTTLLTSLLCVVQTSRSMIHFLQDYLMERYYVTVSPCPGIIWGNSIPKNTWGRALPHMAWILPVAIRISLFLRLCRSNKSSGTISIRRSCSSHLSLLSSQSRFMSLIIPFLTSASWRHGVARGLALPLMYKCCWCCII